MRSILILDSSLQGALLGVATAKESPDGSFAWELLCHQHFEKPQDAAASLPTLVVETLRSVGLKVSDLTALLVGVGPGSFTGIKIGLSFAYGLKRSSPALKLWGASALQSLAKVESDRLWILPATQSSGYFAQNTALGVVQETADASGTFKLQGSPSGWPAVVNVLGSWPRFSKFCLDQGINLREESIGSLSQSVLSGMLEDFIANSERLSDGLPEPLYLRKSAPEEKLEQVVFGAQ